MQVLLADSLGICFGVRDALAAVRQLPQPTQVTIRGELVHNPVITHELHGRGFQLQGENVSGPIATTHVLITAHGVSDRERERLTAAGKSLIDTTCPLVARAHRAALTLQQQGYFVVVFGRPDHVEVRGLTGDLHTFTVVERLADVRRWPHEKIGLIAQTTSIQEELDAIAARATLLNPHAEVRIVNTICQPTRDRQSALERLLDRVDLLVVVGGRHSNNTLRLVQRARDRGTPALHIEHETELEPSAFAPHQRIGLTAGTSTLPETIHAVHQRLLSFHAGTAV